jgi:hypothetical protein
LSTLDQYWVSSDCCPIVEDHIGGVRHQLRNLISPQK